MIQSHEQRTCSVCGFTGPIEVFPKSGVVKGVQYRRRQCRPCYNVIATKQAARTRNPERSRWVLIKSLYSVTRPEWEALFAAQGNRCAVCRSTEHKGHNWHTDHDKTCCPGKKSCGRCVRGILCSFCNVALGYAKDDPAILQSMIDYLTADRRPKLRAI